MGVFQQRNRWPEEVVSRLKSQVIYRIPPSDPEQNESLHWDDEPRTFTVLILRQPGTQLFMTYQPAQNHHDKAGNLNPSDHLSSHYTGPF